jgi:DNA-directed RNA polymerase subunit K/omega
MSDIEEEPQEVMNEEEDVIAGDEEEDVIAGDEEEDVIAGDEEDEEVIAEEDDGQEQGDDMELSEEEDEMELQNKVPVLSEDDETSISDEELDEDDKTEDMMDVRIDDEYKVNYIKQIHPEEVNDSFHEMNAFANISRDKNSFIDDESHVTYPILTKYEKTRILGLRITQLNEGARPLIETQNEILDNHIIAERELREKVLPFIIMRPLPNGKKEYWRLEDLEIIER